jgi:leader peptidase (prepilin peptidase)/N-methyltransferase
VTTAAHDHNVTVAAGVVGCALAAGGQPGWAALAILLGVAAGVVPADLRHRRIPTCVVAVGAAATLAAVAITTLHDQSWTPIATTAGAGALVGGAFLVVHLVHPAGLGFGDVRLAALAGALTGYGTASIAAAAVTAALAAAVASLATIATRSKSAPFAPYLLGAAAVAVAVSIRR